MSGVESVVVDAFLHGLLSGDEQLVALAPGGVWADVAPEGTHGVVVLVVAEGGLTDTTPAVGIGRTLSQGTWTVKAVGDSEDTFLDLAQVAARIDALVQGASGGVDLPGVTGHVYGCDRVGDVHMRETGTPAYRHLGGSYRVTVR